jgi:hypothetical protein
MIHHWQCARETEANRASVRVRFGAEFNRRSAEHLGARLELDVDFEADGGDVAGCHVRN